MTKTSYGVCVCEQDREGISSLPLFSNEETEVQARAHTRPPAFRSREGGEKGPGREGLGLRSGSEKGGLQGVPRKVVVSGGPGHTCGREGWRLRKLRFGRTLGNEGGTLEGRSKGKGTFWELGLRTGVGLEA